MNINEKDEVLDINLDDLFKDSDDLDSQETDQSESEETETNDTENTTEAVSKRINEVKRKTESETQDRIARELGYDSYKDLQDANKNKMLRDAGIDTDDTELMATIDKLIEKRLAEDSRIKKVEEYENQQKANFVTNQLKEINKVAGSNYTSIDQLPRDTLDLWEKTGNLKQAYLATHAEELLTKRNTSSKPSLNHLGDQSSPRSGQKTRPLTDEEKDIWRSVFGDISDEELSKKTMPMD
jgi:hypothetical protein